MKEKTKNNWQRFILCLFAVLIAILFAGLIYFNGQIEQNNKLLDKLASQNLTWQKDLTKLALEHQNIIQQYIDTANLVLSSNQDTKTAILLLDAAKKYAGNVSDSNIIIGLDKNINLLKAIDLVNIEELIAKIDIIGASINSLPIIPKTAPVSSSRGEVRTVQAGVNLVGFIAIRQALRERLWRSVNQILTSLKDIVVIRRNALDPMVFTEQEAILRFNLDAKIMQMRLAVMQKHNAIYHNCLTQIASLIRKYFICSSSEKDRILREIDELQKINLQPQLSKITLEFKS